MLQPGDTFERYTVEALIGQGGMGHVYRARDTRLGRRVALKLISDRASTRDAAARLVREARAAAALDHPNAVAIFDVGELDGTPYIVMELVEGRTLRAAVDEPGARVEARVAQLADVGRALAAAHRRGLVHRDVKPENVMIREDGMVKVLDFGIARRAGGDVDPAGPTQTHAPPLSTLTIEGIKLGTPVYMAPEQIRGDPLDGRADQFSWGVVAYEVLAGRLPWRGADALAAMASALTEPVDRAPLEAAGVPAGVADVVLRALSKRPEDRFTSMEEAVRALESAARGEPVPAAAAPSDPVPNATSEQRFTTAEVREVLARAVEKQAAKEGTTKLGFDDLLAVAAEVGVDPESLREASRALRAGARRPPQHESPAPAKGAPQITANGETAGLSAEDAVKRDVWLRRKKRAFHRHLGVYLIVNGALLIFGLVLLSFTPWWVWFIPALGWGIGLAIHGLTALTANQDDWEIYNERMRWWMEQRRLRHEERLARGRGREGREGRGRIEAAPAPPEKLRVAGERVAVQEKDRLSEEIAEEEALLSQQQKGRRK